MNDKAHAVPVLDATQPYEDTCTMYLNGGLATCRFKSTPPHKRLIIQEFDTFVLVPSGSQPTWINVSTTGTGTGYHYFPLTWMANDGFSTFYSSHQETHLYVGAGKQPTCNFADDPPTTGGFAQCQFSGFLVNVP